MPVVKHIEDNRRVFYKILQEFIDSNRDQTISAYYKGLHLPLAFGLNYKLKVRDGYATHSLNQFIQYYAADRVHVGGAEAAPARVELKISEIQMVPKLKEIKFRNKRGYNSISDLVDEYFRITKTSDYRKLMLITNDSIIAAFLNYKPEDVGANEGAKKYLLISGPKSYPAKFILKRAYKISTNKELDYQSDDDSTYEFLNDRGFKCEIIEGGSEDVVVITPNTLVENIQPIPPRGTNKHFQQSVNYIDKAIRDAELGTAGEQLVIDLEKIRLTKLRRPDLAAAIIKQPDIFGYDILSFGEDGSEKYIEVKTTTGNSSTPFFITKNERNFMDNNTTSYFIFRVFNYNKELNNGELKVFTYGDILNFTFEPKVFVCYPK